MLQNLGFIIETWIIFIQLISDSNSIEHWFRVLPRYYTIFFPMNKYFFGEWYEVILVNILFHDIFQAAQISRSGRFKEWPSPVPTP